MKRNVTKLAAAKKLDVAKKVHSDKNRRLQDRSMIGIPDKNGIIVITDEPCFLERCKICAKIFFDARKAKQHASICSKRPASKSVKKYLYPN
jgi:hypothetical protein